MKPVWYRHCLNCNDRDRAEIVQDLDPPGRDNTGHCLAQPLLHPLNYYNCLDVIEATAKRHDSVSAGTAAVPPGAKSLDTIDFAGHIDIDVAAQPTGGLIP
jgi:hypothetical protein